MSTGFIAWYALPTSVLTGVTISHLLFLPADVLGVRASSRLVAALSAATLGAGVSLAIAAIWIVGPRVLPAAAPAIAAFAGVVVQLTPLIAPAASVRLGGWRAGLVAAALATAGWFGAHQLLGDEVAASVVTGSLPLAWHVLRGRVIDAPGLDFSDQTRTVRRSVPGLLVFAALVGALAGRLAIAGEPLAAWLLAAGRPASAAAIAALSAAAFLPLVVTSSMTSGVYSTQGYPDWLFAPGYLTAPIGPGSLPTPGLRGSDTMGGSITGSLVGAVGGMALMAAETLGLRRLAGWLVRHPDCTAMGAAVRSAMTDVLNIASLLGGLAGTLAIAPQHGPLIYGGLVVGNELAGRRVPALGLGPAALVAVILLQRVLGGGL